MNQTQLVEQLIQDFKNEEWQSPAIDRLSNFLNNFAGVAPGSVVLFHQDGTQTTYKTTVDSNSARWTTLTTANSAAISGDKMVIGPGTYDGGSSSLHFNSNLTAIFGAGYKATLLHSTYVDIVNGTVAFVPASNQEYAGIDFEGSSETDIAAGASGNQPFGAANTDTAFTNVYVHDCKIGGVTDAVYVKHDSACSAIFKNCEIVSEFDAVRVFVMNAGQTPAHAFDFYSCNLLVGGTNASLKRGVAITSAGKIRLFNCNILCDDASDSGGAGTHGCVGINASTTPATVEMYGGSILTQNGSSNTDVQQQNTGIVKYANVIGSGTGGALTTSGSPTNLTSSGVAIAGTAGTTVTLPAAGKVYLPLFFNTGAITWVNGQVLYFTSTQSTTQGARLIAIPFAGTIIAAEIITTNTGTLATSESVTVAVNINNTPTTISSAVKFDALKNHYEVTGLNIALAAGDTFEIKTTSPTWVTPPTASVMTVLLLIQY